MSLEISSNYQFPTQNPKDSLQPNKTSQRVLPILTRSSHKQTLVLDLDETLIHSDLDSGFNHDFTVFLPNSTQKTMYVKCRPGLAEFLAFVSNKKN